MRFRFTPSLWKLLLSGSLRSAFCRLRLHYLRDVSRGDAIRTRSPTGPVQPTLSRRQDAASCLLAPLPHYASALWRLRAPSEHYNPVVNIKPCSKIPVLRKRVCECVSVCCATRELLRGGLPLLTGLTEHFGGELNLHSVTVFSLSLPNPKHLNHEDNVGMNAVMDELPVINRRFVSLIPQLINFF